MVWDYSWSGERQKVVLRDMKIIFNAQYKLTEAMISIQQCFIMNESSQLKDVGKGVFE